MRENFISIIKSQEAIQEEKEEVFLQLQKFNVQNNDFKAIKDDVIELKNYWENITTARVIKIIKRVFDIIPLNKDVYSHVLSILDSLIEWASNENKKMLKLDLECKRIHFLVYTGKYHEALKCIQEIVKELKKYEDKINLITIYVYESKSYYEIKNFAKSRSSLTSARALAVSSYCTSSLQAQIDILNGMYLCDERNYTTAFSYFIEAIEGFTLDKKFPEACVALRYLILACIISKKWGDINTILKNKNTQNYNNDDLVQLLIKISESCMRRSLKEYTDLIENNKCLLEDNFIRSHLEYMYDMLLESNILKIIEPYCVIFIENIAKMLNFEKDVIENKVRKMILDGQIKGILNHSDSSLILYDDKEEGCQEEKYIEQIAALENIASNK